MKNSPVFYTLTGNLLAERTQEFASWSPGKTQRATAESFQVGGKGINVSKMLARLGIPNTTLCFAGGSSGSDCIEWLRVRGFTFHAFPARTATRTGLVVRAPGLPETTFLGPDTPPDASALRACADFLNALPDAAIIALCGSFPGWESPETAPVRDALSRLFERATVCVDSYGPLLNWVVHRPAALVKINRDEFDRLFPDSADTAPLSDRLVEARRRWPVHRWIITDGPGAVWFVEKSAENSPPSSRLPPAVEEVSATGSGDVLFACVLQALFMQRVPLADAVSFALPFASANAASPGIADFSMNQLPQSRSFPQP